MRIAIVVQRYGPDVVGGSEQYARELAQYLQPYIQTEVLTTCARDLLTWQDHYAPGVEYLNQVLVRRFPVGTPRDIARFNAATGPVLQGSASYFQQIEWMQMQGPMSPDLFNFIREQRDRYDLFVFMTYLYASSFVGMQLVPEKSILIPCAHDEPTLHMDIFRSIFQLPQGMLFNTLDEQDLVLSKFGNGRVPHAVIGSGVSIPDVIAPLPIPYDDYILYMGRVDTSKGCDQLFEYFLDYKQLTHDPVKLVLIGTKMMPVPDHPDIIALGYLPGDDRFAWLQKAMLYVHPSSYESLSISTLEALSLGVPVLVNGRVPVLKSHVDKSRAGSYYQSKQEFIDSLRRMRADSALRAEMSLHGKAYVNQWYEWRTITEKHVAFFKQIYQLITPHTSQKPPNQDGQPSQHSPHNGVALVS